MGGSVTALTGGEQREQVLDVDLAIRGDVGGARRPLDDVQTVALEGAAVPERGDLDWRCAARGVRRGAGRGNWAQQRHPSSAAAQHPIAQQGTFRLIQRCRVLLGGGLTEEAAMTTATIARTPILMS